MQYYHRIRKKIHFACFLAFAALPFVNFMRFDIPRQRFYFAGNELMINEFGIIFFALMFLMFLIVASSVLYGRVYCGYMCPQMIFSEASTALESKLRRVINKRFISWPAARRSLAVRIGFLGVLAVCSVFLAFIFISYFVEPRDLLNRLSHLDLKTAGGIAGASVTLITFLDFAFVRQRFCTTVCPYGYIQGMLGDDNTLLVHYRDEQHDCIECKKCIRVCEMGIDIRKSPFQIECIHCGECIDACTDVLARLGKGTLIHYAWGEHGSSWGGEKTGWLRRLGFRDAKRFVVLLVVLFYLAGLSVALSMRRAVLVRISPVRAQLYRVSPDGRVLNKFRCRLANRGSKPAFVVLSIDGLPGAKLVIPENPIAVKPGESADSEFEVAATPFRGAADVNHFIIRAYSEPEGATDNVPMTFLMPVERSTP